MRLSRAAIAAVMLAAATVPAADTSDGKTGSSTNAIEALRQDARELSSHPAAARETAALRRDAARTPQAKPEPAPDALYAKYNQGIAALRTGSGTDGMTLLAAVGDASVATPELRGLRDRANVALGQAWLDRGDGARARARFERVQLTGLVSNQALLGLGWTYATAERYPEALAPWYELRRRDPADPAVQQCLLAVPYALNKLRAFRQSADQYQHAITVYGRERERLATWSREVNAETLIDLAERDDPRHAGPAARYFLDLALNNEIRAAWQNYRELRSLRDDLGRIRRIDSLAQRADVLVRRATDLSSEQARTLVATAQREIKRRQERLDGLVAEARLALAQLYDRASVGGP